MNSVKGFENFVKTYITLKNEYYKRLYGQKILENI